MEKKKLYRVQEGKVIAGVCSGLAQHLNVEVTYVRVAFAVAALLSVGLAFWGYMFLWVMTPKTPEGASPIDSAIHEVKSFFTTPTPQGYPKPEEPKP